MEKKGNNDLEEVIERLKNRIKELEDINDGHRQLNGTLRVQLQEFKKVSSELESANNLLLCYRKVVEKDGKLHEIKRMEVHENAHPIIGFGKTMSHRLVLKTQKAHKIILPDKLMQDY